MAYSKCTFFNQVSSFTISDFSENTFEWLLFYFLGIPPHIDTHSAFVDGILSFSLNSQVRVTF